MKFPRLARYHVRMEFVAAISYGMMFVAGAATVVVLAGCMGGILTLSGRRWRRRKAKRTGRKATG
ncbi:MAG: hypothetical protein ACRD3I_07460 [Terriglobales bacterium]